MRKTHNLTSDRAFSTHPGSEPLSPDSPELGDVTSRCTHSGVIPGIDSCYCPDCKKSWSQWHPDYKSLFAASGKRHSGEIQSDNDAACSDNDAACNVEPEMPATPTTLKVGDKVCLKNQRVVGSIVSIEGERAKVCFGEDAAPISIKLSNLVLAATIIVQPTDLEEIEEDWTDYEDEDPVEQAIARQQAQARVLAPGFNYDALEVETRIIVLSRTREIKDWIRSDRENIFNIGQKRKRCSGTTTTRQKGWVSGLA